MWRRRGKQYFLHICQRHVSQTIWPTELDTSLFCIVNGCKPANFKTNKGRLLPRSHCSDIEWHRFNVDWQYFMFNLNVVSLSNHAFHCMCEECDLSLLPPGKFDDVIDIVIVDLGCFFYHKWNTIRFIACSVMTNCLNFPVVVLYDLAWIIGHVTYILPFPSPRLKFFVTLVRLTHVETTTSWVFFHGDSLGLSTSKSDLTV